MLGDPNFTSVGRPPSEEVFGLAGIVGGKIKVPAGWNPQGPSGFKNAPARKSLKNFHPFNADEILQDLSPVFPDRSTIGEDPRSCLSPFLRISEAILHFKDEKTHVTHLLMCEQKILRPRGDTLVKETKALRHTIVGLKLRGVIGLRVIGLGVTCRACRIKKNS